MFLAMGLTIALGAGPTWADSPTKSPLPGYPRFRGVMLVRDGSAASAARENAIRSALKAASGSTNPNCILEGTNPGADLCFWGGPVVKAHTVHLIFWEGPTGHPFPAEYVAKVEAYFASVAAASKAAGEENSSVYSVSTQYGGTGGPVTFKVAFGSPADVFVDSAHPLPPAGGLTGQCEDGTFTTCVTDKRLQEEVEAAELLKGWESSREDIYFVFTPPNVGSCFEPGSSSEGDVCALVSGGYCAYHSDFGTSGKETLYANIPDGGNVEGCDSFEHPNGPAGVDATLDAASHEHNETITDPLGTSWFDVIGQEIADKCLPPETFDTYGGAFGGLSATENAKGEITPGTLYNQILGSGHYFLQREWSNAAFNGEGGCVARMLHTEFAPPTEAKATAPATFDGSASGETGDPAVYWVWSFGDGMQVGTPQATVSHTYAEAGSYRVTLTAFDEHGNSNTHTIAVQVGAAPPPTPPTTTSPAAPTTTTVTRTVTEAGFAPPVISFTANQLAVKLGLPANGATLAGLGTIPLGHAECPPACSIALKLYATVPTTKHHHRTAKAALIGALATTVAVKGTGALALRLNATGRRLLGKQRRQVAQLVVTVVGQEGGSWVVKRSLVLTGSGHLARRR